MEFCPLCGLGLVFDKKLNKNYDGREPGFCNRICKERYEKKQRPKRGARFGAGSQGKYTPSFNGDDYKPEKDHSRLNLQMTAIRDYMLVQSWKTLNEISAITGAPEASVSAQLRHLRKDRFGGYIVRKRRRPGENGLYEYFVMKPGKSKQMEMFKEGEGI